MCLKTEERKGETVKKKRMREKQWKKRGRGG